MFKKEIVQEGLLLFQESGMSLLENQAAPPPAASAVTAAWLSVSNSLSIK